MAFKLAEMFVQLGVKSSLDADFRKARSETDSALQTLTAHANRAAGGLGLLVAGSTLAGLGALAAGLYKGVQKAANLQETLTKVEQVFEASTYQITGLAAEMADAYGSPKKAILDAAASIGLIGQAAGQSAGQSAAMAKELTKLATDASSFFNIPLDETLEKIRSGLVGQARPMRELGVLLSEDAVKLEAYRLGLAKVGSELTDAQKVQARFSLIKTAPSMRKAEGDLERTKDSPKNREREIAGRAQSIMTSAGQAVMPLWKEIINQVNSVVRAISAFVAESRPKIEAWARDAVDSVRAFALQVQDLQESLTAFASSESFASAFAAAAAMIRGTLGVAFTWLKGLATEVFDGIALVLRNFDDITALAALNVQESLMNVGAVFEWLPKAAGAFLLWLNDNWVKGFKDAFNAAWAVVSNFHENLKNIVKAAADFMANPVGGFNFVFTPLLEGFKATMAALPEIAGPAWADFSREQQEILDRIGANEARFAAEKARRALEMAKGVEPAAARGAVKPAEAAAPVKPGKFFQGGIVEFLAHLQAGSFGKDDAAKTAENTGKMVGVMKEVSALLKKDKVMIVKAE